MVSVYLPVFSGANQNLTDVPLIIVNEDSGHMGDAILLNVIEKQNGNSFNWEITNNKQNALDDLKNDKAFGALMIHANYSKDLSQLHEILLAGKGNGEAATLEILLNEGVGQSAYMIASNTLQTVAFVTSEAISKNFKNELNEKGITLSPDNALLLNTPVNFTVKDVLGLPVNLNKGMTPFMMTLIASISGLMGANMIHAYLMKGNVILKKNESSLSESKILNSRIDIWNNFILVCLSYFAIIGIRVFRKFPCY